MTGPSSSSASSSPTPPTARPRQPRLGETILGERFTLGPGGKGSNQAVAAARAGGRVHIHHAARRRTPSPTSRSPPGPRRASTPEVERSPESYTGAAYIFLESGTGQNAIIVAPGAAGLITEADIDAKADLIRGGLGLRDAARAAAAGRDPRACRSRARRGSTTILNPAPAAPLPDGTLALCDWVTPNESEAEALTGHRRRPTPRAPRRRRGGSCAGGGRRGGDAGRAGRAAPPRRASRPTCPALRVGEVVDTTGAGDAFNGGFAVALSEGRAPLDAVRFGIATAGISVTRPGTAPAMPSRAEIDALALAGREAPEQVDVQRDDERRDRARRRP